MFQEDNVVDSALDTTEDIIEESYEQDDDTREGEGSEAETSERKPESPEQRIARLKRQLEREERKLGIQVEKPRKEANQTQEVSNDVVLARLEARGVLDSDIQTYLLSEAKRLQKSPVELLTDSYYIAKVEEKNREKAQEAARPAPSSRTGSTDRSGDVNYHLQRAKDGKGLPSDAVMRRKIVKLLAGR